MMVVVFVAIEVHIVEVFDSIVVDADIAVEAIEVVVVKHSLVQVECHIVDAVCTAVMIYSLIDIVAIAGVVLVDHS